MKTILIVDDNQYILDFLQNLLLRLGYQVIAKSDGCAALDALSKGEAVDLVITDYVMPCMDGLELLATLKHIAPSVPVIMVSAEPRADIYLRARALGAFEFLEKPVHQHVLRRIVEDALMRPWPQAEAAWAGLKRRERSE